MPYLEAIEDEDELIDSGTRFIRTIVRRVVQIVRNVVQGVDTGLRYIPRYTYYAGGFFPNTASTVNKGKGANPWCGPWVVSYLEWIRSGRIRDTYATAWNYTFRWFGSRPMLSEGMNHALRNISHGRISINGPIADSLAAHNHIRNRNRPVVMFGFSSNAIPHWEIAVGTRASGNVVFQNFFFLLHDNSTAGMNFLDRNGVITHIATNNTNRRNNSAQYRQARWTNLWYLVNY